MIDPTHIKNPLYPRSDTSCHICCLWNYFSTLTTPSDSPDLLPSDDPNTLHVMKKDVTFLGRVKRGYFCRKHDKKYSTKRQGSVASHALIRTRNFIIVIGFSWLIQRQGLYSWNIKIICHNFSVNPFCLPSILYFTCWTLFLFVFFLFCWSLPVLYHMSDLIGILILYCFCWLFECMWWKSVQASKLYWTSSCI